MVTVSIIYICIYIYSSQAEPNSLSLIQTKIYLGKKISNLSQASSWIVCYWVEQTKPTSAQFDSVPARHSDTTCFSSLNKWNPSQLWRSMHSLSNYQVKEFWKHEKISILAQTWSSAAAKRSKTWPWLTSCFARLS